MGLFSKARRQTRERAWPRLELLDTKQSETLAGAVQVDSATTRPQPEQYEDYHNAYAAESWVNVCVNRIIYAVAALPLKLYFKEYATGDREEVFNHQKANLWCKSPNPYMSKTLFWQSIVGYKILDGGGFVEKTYPGAAPNTPDITQDYQELYPVNSLYMTIKPHPQKYIDYYEYTNPNGNGQAKKLRPEQIKYFRTFNPKDDFYGLSRLSAASIATTLDLYSQAHMQNFFKQGARPSVVFHTDQKLDDSDVRRIRLQIRSYYQGVKKAWLPIVLHNGLRAYEFSMSNKDAEFVSVRKLTREEMAAVLNVPPALAGIFEYANYANTYAQKELFYEGTIRPECQAIEDDLNMELRADNQAILDGRAAVIDHKWTLNPSNPRLGELYFEFVLDDVLKAEPAVRNNIYRDGVEMGYLRQNDVRKMENKDPVPWGNEWYMPLNKIPVSLFTRDDVPDKEKVRRLTEYITAANKMSQLLTIAADRAGVELPPKEGD